MVSIKLRFLVASLLVGCGATTGDEGSPAAPTVPTSSRPTASVDLPEAVDALAQSGPFVYAVTAVQIDAERSTIHRIEKSSLRVEPLIEVPGRAAQVGWLAADADGIYWLNLGADSTGIWRADKDGGGAVQLVGGASADPRWFAGEATLDGDRIVYVEGATSGITHTRVRSISKTGGPATDVPSVPGTGLVTDDAFIYSCASDGIYRTSKSGGRAERIGAPPCAQLQRDGTQLSWLFNPWIIADVGGGAVALASPTGLYALPVTGGVASKLASGNFWAFASNTGEQFTIDYGASAFTATVLSPRRTMVTVTFGGSTDGLPSGSIVADEERVFWSEPRHEIGGWRGSVRSIAR